MNPTVSLTAEQIACYHAQGYLALPAITTAEEIARLRLVYDRLFARRAGRDVGDQFDLAGADEAGKQERLPQILNPGKYEPELANSLYRVNALHIAQQLLGADAIFRGDHAILKPPRDGAATPWHQDEAYWDPALEYHSLSIWMPLQEATPENGCMTFIPGSHRLEVQPHHPINHDPRIHGLEVDELDASTAVACPLPAGGCTIHDSRTFHYTPPNRSDQPRRAYILGFGLPATPRVIPRNFYWNTLKHTAREDRARQAALQGAAVQRAPGV